MSKRFKKTVHKISQSLADKSVFNVQATSIYKNYSNTRQQHSLRDILIQKLND